MRVIDVDGWLPMQSAPRDGEIIRVKLLPGKSRIAEHRVKWTGRHWTSLSIRGAQIPDNVIVGWKLL